MSTSQITAAALRAAAPATPAGKKAAGMLARLLKAEGAEHFATMMAIIIDNGPSNNELAQAEYLTLSALNN